MTTYQSAGQPPTELTTPSAPPPLPVPGSARQQDGAATGGREVLPGQELPGEARPTGGRKGRCGASAVGGPLLTYLVFMAFFVVLWALGGGGHFWPVWPMLGWGLGLVNSGAVRLPRARRQP